jgi:hypothetical protein
LLGELNEWEQTFHRGDLRITPPLSLELILLLLPFSICLAPFSFLLAPFNFHLAHVPKSLQ